MELRYIFAADTIKAVVRYIKSHASWWSCQQKPESSPAHTHTRHKHNSSNQTSSRRRQARQMELNPKKVVHQSVLKGNRGKWSATAARLGLEWNKKQS